MKTLIKKAIKKLIRHETPRVKSSTTPVMPTIPMQVNATLKMDNAEILAAKQAFASQFQVIKDNFREMVDNQGRLESASSSPGHYWGAQNNSWFEDLYKQQADWAYDNFRWYMHENQSGTPYGDYSQFPADMDEEGFQKLGFVRNYINYVSDVPEKFHIQEPVFNSAKQWGLNYKGKQLSANVERFQRYVTNFYKLGILENLLAQSKQSKPLYMLEIGSGFGMLADYLLNIFTSNTKFVLVDIRDSKAALKTIYL
jgi:hypothetical protein